MEIVQILNTSVQAAADLLEHKDEERREAFVLSAQHLVDALAESEEDEIQNCALQEKVRNTLLADRRFLPVVGTTAARRVSIVATVIAYQLSKERGLPDHSREYMDWVKQLNEQISIYYNEKVRAI